MNSIDQPLRREDAIDLRDVDLFPPREVPPEDLRVASLLLVVHLFVNGGMKLVEGSLPIHTSDQVRIAFESSSDSAKHQYVKVDLIVNGRALHLDCDRLPRAQLRAMNLSQARRRDRHVFEAVKDVFDLCS